MTTEALIQIITQGSSILALLIGIVTLYLSYKAQNGLIKGEFKRTIVLFFIFIILAGLSILSMVIYHFNYSELADLLWIGGIYLALILSLYESKKIIDLGKLLSRIGKIKFRKK